MQLTIIDIQPAVVAVVRAALRPLPEVEVVEGDILEVTRNAVVSPANSYRFTDGGIDLV